LIIAALYVSRQYCFKEKLNVSSRENDMGLEGRKELEREERR
jgi:hypothetical protein